jgi:cytochrome P450
LETQIAIPALLERYSRIELQEDDPAWSQTLTLRGLKRLNVMLHA